MNPAQICPLGDREIITDAEMSQHPGGSMKVLPNEMAAAVALASKNVLPLRPADQRIDIRKTNNFF